MMFSRRRQAQSMKKEAREKLIAEDRAEKAAIKEAQDKQEADAREREFQRHPHLRPNPAKKPQPQKKGSTPPKNPDQDEQDATNPDQDEQDGAKEASKP